MEKLFLVLGLVGTLAMLNAQLISKNGITKDSATGLMWQDNRDTVSVQKNWDNAQTYCENLTLGGFSDWRLPNIYELETTLNQSKIQKPNIIDGFLYNPKNGSQAIYWSSSLSVVDSDNRMALTTWGDDFGASNLYKKYDLGVRCVRGKELNFKSLNSLIERGKLHITQNEIENLVIMAQPEKISSAKTTYNIGKERDTHQGYSVYPVSCSAGASADVIFNYDKPSDWLRYVVRGTQSFKTINEAANYICGNR